MLFKGRLRLPSDPGEGIPIGLELEDVILSLVSEGEDFGEWRLDKVEIKRLFSNQFSLLLDGEEMVFVADDALGFAYDGLAFVEDVTARLSKRRLFKGRKPGKRQQEQSSEAVQPDEEIESTRIPEIVPFFPEPAEPAAAVAAAPPIQQAAAPLGHQMSDLVSDEPEVAEVHAPRNTVQVAPAMPAGEVDPVFVDPIEPSAAPVEPASPEPEAAEIIVPEAPEVLPAAHIEPVIEAVDVPEEAELVIEDVAAYGYMPPVDIRSEKSIPDHVADPIESVDPVIESVESPAARAPEMHPLGEVDPPTAAAVETATASPQGPTEATGGETQPVVTPEPTVTQPETPTVESVGPVETAEPVQPAHAQPVPLDQPFSAAQPAPTFAQWSSNGHAAEVESSPNGIEAPIVPEAEVDDGPQTQKSGRHARSVGRSRSGSFFGRKKSREPEEHEHRYESSKTVGGITRSICAVCDHVSFAGEDVYQGW